MNERYQGYIVEFLRLFVLVVFLTFLGYLLKILPFISELPFIKYSYSLGEFVEFIVFVVISFLLIEFSYRVETKVDYIFNLPACGIIHRYIFFVISGLLIYWGGINTFSKLIGAEWLWIYQMFFAGFTLFMFTKIFFIIYNKGEEFGKSLYSKIRQFI